MSMNHILAALLSLTVCCNAIAASEKTETQTRCKSNPKLVSSCFLVHGRLSAYNGNPSLRIWPVGTHRLLGIVEDEEPRSLPENIRSLAGFKKDIYGDFLVCPFTTMNPGQMQLVCVETASNVHVQNRQ